MSERPENNIPGRDFYRNRDPARNSSYAQDSQSLESNTGFEPDSSAGNGDIDSASESRGKDNEKKSHFSDSLKKGVSASSLATGAAKHLAGKNETVQKVAKTVDDTQKVASAIGFVATKAAVAGKAVLATMAPPHGPIIWIVVIIAIIASYLAYGAYLSTGRNDNRAVCLDEDSMNNQIGSISLDASEREIAQEIGDFLTSESFDAFGGPLSVEQAAGLVGNMIHESAGLRPYVREGNAGNTTLMTNSEVRQWRVSKSGSVQGSNAAIGMIQWDGPRAEALISFAEDRGSQWYEFDIQMQYLAHEMNNGYEAQQIRSNSQLTSTGGSVGQYTVGFQDTFFRPNAALAHTDRRTAAAIEFMEYFDAGSYSQSHGYVVCNDTSNLAVGTIAETAMSMAWEWGDVNNAKTGCSFNSNGGRACGRSEAKPEYIEAKEKAHQETGMDPLVNGDLYASCDRFVAAVLRVTGVDENVPWGSAATQKAHFQSSSQYTQVGSGNAQTINWSQLRPGDILSTDQHVAIYIGEIGGQPMVAHASIQANFQNNGNGMVGYQGPVSSLSPWSYTVFRSS